MSKTNDYILSMQTDEPLPMVEIDGEGYPLRLDVEYAELLRAKDLGEEVQRLTDKKQRTEQDEARLQELVRETAAASIKAPEDVLNKLTDLQRFQIVQVFGDQVSRKLRPDPTEAGGGNSRGSGGITAAR